MRHGNRPDGPIGAGDFHSRCDGHAPIPALERGIRIRKQSSEGKSEPMSFLLG
jgi:hypothetical protein